ncbi:MAG: SRPBCC domain-containing protein [Chloroflexi bacterium]|nr:MAG: SRPBCC domain-containing protein [Chloroflexota bacterium]
MSKIHIVRDYPYPVATVWRALTDPALIPRWTSTGAGGRPEGFSTSVGTRFRFVAKPGLKPGWNGIVNCVVLEVQEPTLLRYSWQDDGGGEITEVIYRLEPHAGGTRFTYDHTGFSGIGGFAMSRLLGNVRRKMLTVGLPAVLADVTRTEEPAHEMA